MDKVYSLSPYIKYNGQNQQKNKKGNVIKNWGYNVSIN